LLARREYLLDRSEYLLARSQYLLARSEYLLARSQYLLALSQYLLARSQYLLARSEYLLARSQYLLARSHYSEGPATGHHDTGFSRFPCVYKQTLRQFPTFPVATTCFSRSPADLNLVVTDFTFCLHVK